MSILKKSPLTDEEIEMLRENFIIKYAKDKGWNPYQLKDEQLLEIKTQKEYKTPGLLCS